MNKGGMLMKKINDMIQILEEKGRFKETKNFIQHGDVSVKGVCLWKE